jgi:predicted nucleic acid-binding Zn ribbon protein
VGEQRAAHTQPAVFKDRLLVVYTDSSAWIHELHFQKNEIVAKLNTALKKELIHDIRFQIGPIHAADDNKNESIGRNGSSR